MTANAPKDRPIIFSAPMVRALLDGRKTQTRRVLKPQPEATWSLDPARWPAARVGRFWFTDDPAMPGNHCICARFEPGDRLWVRENHALVGGGDPGIPIYAANWREDARARGFDNIPDKPPRWTPSIHMPRWASRLTLIVTDVRVQRLQDISEEDAIAEGVSKIRDCCYVVPGFDYDKIGLCHTSPVTPFQKLWESINGEESWAANPWVVAITFRTIKANIDSAEAKAA